MVCESQGVSIDAAAKRWSDLRGALSVTGEEWAVLESQGYVPDAWESIIHYSFEAFESSQAHGYGRLRMR